MASAETPLARRLRVVVPLLVAVLALLATGVTTAAVRSESDSGTSAESSHPDSWDPRVADIAHFVEKKRGLTYSHPVAVDFLADKDFNGKVTKDQEPTTEERADMDTFVATLRALGMVSGP